MTGNRRKRQGVARRCGQSGTARLLGFVGITLATHTVSHAEQAGMTTSGGDEVFASRISETIVVTGQPADAEDVSFETRHALPEEEFERAHGDVASLIVQLPSAHVPTNSRGESVVSLRNASERQVAIFYDGAAINVPWDNRLDLSLVPAGLVGGARSASGALAPHYGVNALGAVSLSPRKSIGGGEAAVLSGEAGTREARTALELPVGGTARLAVGASYARHDGQPLSGEADLVFSQLGKELRTNTDRRLASGFAHFSADVADHRISLTAFHIDASKGIAPESDRPTGARFWRYPDVGHTLAVANVAAALGDTKLDSAYWYQRFGQTIDSYADVNYARIDAREVDRDETFGLRHLLSYAQSRINLVGSFNFLDSRHRQRDLTFQNGEPPTVLPPSLLYRQRNWSLGGEVEWLVNDNVIAEVGIGYDCVAYVKTGDKPPISEVGGWTGRMAMIWSNASGLLLRAAIGRKLRAATMRELFGQALNRFLINPDLMPEQIVTAEVSAEWRVNGNNIYVTPFYQHLEGTIDQRTVGHLRQRINLVGSRVVGIELGGRYAPADNWQISGNATWSAARRRGSLPGETTRLAEKPELIARLRIAHQFSDRLALGVETEHVGRAFSADPTGQLVSLKHSTSVNVEARYRLATRKTEAELFFDADNITDTLVVPQLGLPAPGRYIRVGARVNW